MQPRRSIPALMMVMSLLVTVGCQGKPPDLEAVPEPATVERSFDSASGLARVHLTAAARDRIDLSTAVANPVGDQTVIPSGALIVDPEGGMWVYTNPEALTYERHPIAVASEVGDRVYLTEGPPPGTEVVILGAAELYGAETGIGH